MGEVAPCRVRRRRIMAGPCSGLAHPPTVRCRGLIRWPPGTLSGSCGRSLLQSGPVSLTSAQQQQSVHEYGTTTTDSGRGTATTCLFCPRDESQGRFTWETADAWMHFPTKPHHGLLPITTASCEGRKWQSDGEEKHRHDNPLPSDTTDAKKQARSENKVRLIGADGVKHVRLNLGRISQIKGANRSANWAVNLPTPALDSLPPNAITI